jgi:hypothetical protein
VWQFPSFELDTSEFLRNEDMPWMSPKFEELNERAQKQVKAAHKTLRGLVKAGVVGEGKIRISASGQAHHEDVMTTNPGDADYIALHIGRVQ